MLQSILNYLKKSLLTLISTLLSPLGLLPKAPPPPALPKGRVSKLQIHPIKSCAAISSHSIRLTPIGCEFDRIWMITDNNGKFITQRTHPKMVLITPSIHTIDPAASGVFGAYHGGGYLCLNAPGMDELRVEFRSDIMSGFGDRVRVYVWDDYVDALDEGDLAAVWISRYLDTECRLVIRDPCGNRVSSDGSVVDSRAFTDQYPVMIMTTESISDVNTRIQERNGRTIVSELNFRSNVYVSGCGSAAVPYEEDTWRDIRIGECEFRYVKRCTRCRLPNVDPVSGVVSEDHNPLKTLMAYRRVDEKYPNHAVLGIQAEHVNEGIIRVGDEVYAS